MNLITRRPYSLFSELQNDLNRAFENRLATSGDSLLGSGNRWVPEVDIHEDDKAYHLTVDLPGIKAEEIDVSAHDGVLTIKGDRETIYEDKELKRSERVYGSFLREFSMPDTADLENIKASSNNGVLNIEIPKTSKAEPKRIPVQ
jgi:HSP20 family protein